MVIHFNRRYRIHYVYKSEPPSPIKMDVLIAVSLIFIRSISKMAGYRDEF